MVSKVNFSTKQLQNLGEILGNLKVICYPPFKDIKPIIQINEPRKTVLDLNGDYTLDELNHTQNSNQPLPAHINAIETNGITWFSSKEDPFTFYSDKGCVTVNFSPQRLHSPTLLNNKALSRCIQKMLFELTQKKLSSHEAERFFPKSICQKVYELDPPREQILQALTVGIGEVRRILFEHLIKNHTQDLQKLPNFQIYQNKSKNSLDALRQFLKDGQRGFLLAQKWGYISNAQRLICYQETRDIPRHPSKLMPNPILNPSFNPSKLTKSQQEDWVYHMGYPYQNPAQLYQDFQKALPFVKAKKPTNVNSYDDAVMTIWAFSEIEHLNQILSSYPRENKIEEFFKKNFPAEISAENVIIEHPDKTQTNEQITRFSSFLIRKDGIAVTSTAQQISSSAPIFKEADFHKWRTLSNVCAHANPGHQEGSQILSHDFQFLTDFVDKLQEAHDKKKLTNSYINQRGQRNKTLSTSLP